MGEVDPLIERRQTIVRRAVLLGFSCHEYLALAPTSIPIRYAFFYDGNEYSAYVSRYSAAYDWLRLQGLHDMVAGDIDAEGFNREEDHTNDP